MRHPPILCVSLAIGLMSTEAMAQAAQSTSHLSLTQAIAVLDEGIHAVGGLEALATMTSFSFERERAWRSIGQDRRPGLVEFGDGVLDVTLDLEGRRGATVDRYTSVGGFRLEQQIVADLGRTDGFRVNLMYRPPGGLIRSSPASIHADWLEWNRTLPHLVLRQANERRATLRYLGRHPIGARPHEVIVYSDAAGTQVTLFFDAADYLLRRVETISANPIFGDVVAAASFSAFEAVSGILMPRRAVYTQNGHVVDESRFTRLVINGGAPDQLFRAPPGYTEPPVAPQRPVMERVAEGVYLANVTQSHRSLVVEVDDYAVIVDAPVSSEVGERLIDVVREGLPARPIRYVATTHHHWDHIGGLRPFIAEGITILTTPGNADHIEALPAIQHVVAPDALSRNPTPAKVEAFTNRRVLGSANRALHLVDIGPTRHAEEMVVAYIPGARLLFQADVLYMGAIDDVRRRIWTSPDLRTLLGAMRRFDLRADTILGAHGTPASFDDLLRAASLSDGWHILSEPRVQSAPGLESLPAGEEGAAPEGQEHDSREGRRRQTAASGR